MFLILAGDDANKENSDIMENLQKSKKKKVWRERWLVLVTPVKQELSAGKWERLERGEKEGAEGEEVDLN